MREVGFIFFRSLHFHFVSCTTFFLLFSLHRPALLFILFKHLVNINCTKPVSHHNKKRKALSLPSSARQIASSSSLLSTTPFLATSILPFEAKLTFLRF